MEFTSSKKKKKGQIIILNLICPKKKFNFFSSFFKVTKRVLGISFSVYWIVVVDRETLVRVGRGEVVEVDWKEIQSWPLCLSAELNLSFCTDADFLQIV